jgi:hypothetical protein
VFTLPPTVTEAALMVMSPVEPVPPASDVLSESPTASEVPAVSVQFEVSAVLVVLVLLIEAQTLLRPIDVLAVTVTAPALPVVPDVADTPALMEPAVMKPLWAFRLTVLPAPLVAYALIEVATIEEPAVRVTPLALPVLVL